MPFVAPGYLGDMRLGDTHYWLINTVDLTGAPTGMTGATPVIAAYVNSSVTQITAGLTMATTFDSVSGLHLMIATLTSGNGFAAGSDVDIVLQGAVSVDGVLQTGVRLGGFSIENRPGIPDTMRAEIVSAVWATPTRTITGGGSSASVDTTAVIAIASGVWDQQRNARNASGSFGNLVQTFGVTVATNSDKTSYTITQAVYDQLTNQIWATPIRTVTAGTITSVTGSVNSVASPIGVGSNFDKTGYALTQAAYDQLVNQAWATPTRTITALGTQAKSDVNAEVVDALATDTYAEPGQGVPTATTTLAAKLNYLYKAWRNRVTQTSSQYALYADDAATVDQKAAVSDDSTTYDRGEIASGP